MSTGHLVGYVGGLAVALGVGTAVLVSAPTASADTSSASSSAHSGTAKSARAAQRTNTVASARRAPARKVDAPTSSVTLLMAASAATDPRRPAAGARPLPAAADTIPIDTGHNLVIDTTGDWSTGFTTRVSLRDNTTGTQVGSTVTLDGTASGRLFSADKDRVLVTTEVYDPVVPYTTEVAVINTEEGTQIGTTLELGGRATGPLLAIDDKHVLITTEVYSLAGDSTHVALIDDSFGTQTGDTLVLKGRVAQGPMLDAAGGHAVIATSGDLSSQYAGQVAVFDVHTGTQAGTTLDFTGSPSLQLIGDGNLALIRAARYDAATGGATDFTLLDTSSGSKVGSGLTLEGTPWNTSAITVAGTNILVEAVNQNYFAGTSTINVAVMDTSNGNLVGHPVSLDGAPWGDPILNDDGVHLLVAGTISGATHVAVIDTATGEQSAATVDLAGVAGYVLPAGDGVHVVVTADDGVSTHLAVIDGRTGDRAGTMLSLTGRLAPPLLSADGIHVLVSATAAGSTEVAVLDTTTGARTGDILTLSGQVAGPLVNADGVHALFAASSDNTTHVVVVDSRTGTSTPTADLAGVMSYTLADAGRTHVLVVTSTGGATHFASFDSATGQPTGVPLSFTGELTAWPYPTTAADGSHALFILNPTGQTHLVLIDITTGAQTGTGLTLPGAPGLPIVSDGGNHTTIYSRIDPTHAHGSSTHVAVIDTTTGNQVGVTTRLTGTPAALPGLSADGHHVVVRTFAGVSATVDTTTGTATTRVERAPWGLDLEAFAITPVGRVLVLIQGLVNAAPVILGEALLFGIFWLLGLVSSLQPDNHAAAVPAAQLSSHHVTL